MAVDPDESLGLYSMLWRAHDDMRTELDIVRSLCLEEGLDSVRSKLTRAHRHIEEGDWGGAYEVCQGTLGLAAWLLGQVLTALPGDKQSQHH